MLTDIEIAQQSKTRPIEEIARTANIPLEYVEPYGRYVAKINPAILKGNGKNGKLILVTAITPTPMGEGKTTTTVGLADALNRIGLKAMVALREPSLGPVFGVKGGAAGGGYAQVLPMEDINLHFTGDFHAISAANNLLAAIIDNHIHQGNSLGIDPRRVTWRRTLDINDRQLRGIISGLGGPVNGVPREDGFDITAASEIMAVVCLSDGINDLKQRLSRMVVGYTYDRKIVTCADLKAQGAMAALLVNAMKPNLVQTIEGTPAFIHGGPFANIAHGCNSLTATRMALRLSDYAVTEAGFGADLGAEKFIDIKCRMSGLTPDAVVIVATARALKMHGGHSKTQLDGEDLEALKKGIPNLIRHADNIKNVFGLPAVVAINRFPNDTDSEIALIQSCLDEMGVDAVLSEAWAKGGEGAEKLARRVAALCETENKFAFCYSDEDSLEEKIDKIVKKIYRGNGVEWTEAAKKQLKAIKTAGYGQLPVCVAKTQYSFSDDPTLLGAPEGFSITLKSLRLSAGAGFIVAQTGDIMTMPGLPKRPSAENIDVDEDGRITGLF